MFGPFLVLRTREPTRTPAEYLDRAAQVMVVGKSLFIGDADINFVTVRRAADRLRPPGLLSAALLELHDLPEARGVLERREAGRRHPTALLRPDPPRRGDRRGGADEAADQERASSAASVVLVHGTIVGRC